MAKGAGCVELRKKAETRSPPLTAGNQARGRASLWIWQQGLSGGFASEASEGTPGQGPTVRLLQARSTHNRVRPQTWSSEGAQKKPAVREGVQRVPIHVADSMLTCQRLLF